MQITITVKSEADKECVMCKGAAFYWFTADNGRDYKQECFCGNKSHMLTREDLIESIAKASYEANPYLYITGLQSDFPCPDALNVWGGAMADSKERARLHAKIIIEKSILPQDVKI